MSRWNARAVALAIGVAALLAACGGGGGSSSGGVSTSPSPAPTTPGIDACSVASGGTSMSASIVNGRDCSTADTRVVLVNLRDASNIPLGACSGTIVAPRAVLTAAHCLGNGTAIARIYLGSGPEQIAQSFAAYPGYREGDPNALDVGVVLMADDIGRGPMPVLLSRDARVGETAVIAGWGNDQNQLSATLRAGTASITAVGATLLQTQFTTTASSVCQGDSGGPLLLQEGGVWAVAGIISANTTTACSSGADFYANVRNSAITSFILDHVPDVARR